MWEKTREEYQPADKTFVVNDGDNDLRPIRISLPRPPRKELIDGHGLPPEEQRFHRIEIPYKLKQLEQDVKNIEYEASKKVNVWLTRVSLQKRFWDMMFERKDQLVEEILWLKKLWWYRLHGYWFYNNGKPTYITGWHFDYLNFWYIAEARPDGHVEYRDRDRKEFLFHKYAYEATETFARRDKNGWAVPEADGSYKMVDLKKRLCYGLVQPKNRRSGNTNKGLSILFSMVSTTIGTDGGGIMSYTGDNAEVHFKGKLVEAFNRMPLFIKPYCNSSFASPNHLRFKVSANEFDISSLQNEITYAETSSSTFYDGKKLIMALLDEEGKCFGKGTRIRMFDGSVKNVEDIQAGDKLMGDDSLPRHVIKLARGKDDMYKIIPKKGESWICNSDHILSVYSCLPKECKLGRGHHDINLQDYLHLSDAHKRNISLYKVGVEYDEKEHFLDPYMLGIWLGDGHSNVFTITNEDKEIVEEIEEFVEKNGYAIRQEGNLYHIHSHVRTIIREFKKGNHTATYQSYEESGEKRSYIKWHSQSRYPNHYYTIEKPVRPRSILKTMGIWQNKHIPVEYLIDSRKNRMDLLAGIIDSDGHRQKGRNAFEITQKNHRLSMEIFELVRSLGFSASINSKIAKMKREDGSIYESKVWRVHIYGKDLYKVPCRVSRKKIENIPHTNRDPMHSGFSVIKDKPGEYFGFVIDGNHRFLLEDYTVVHNTTTTDVDDRWGTVKNCLSQGDGSIIHGYAYHPSTAEEYTSGGAAYRNMATKSSFYQRKPNGQTQSGLFRLYVRSDEALDGFIDSYGYSVKDKILKYQKKEGFTQTATEYILDDFEFLLKQDTPESLAEYRKKRKQFPMSWKDVWVGESGEIGFPTELIVDRINTLRKKELTVPGNFEWTRGFGSDVQWVPDSDGRWEVSELFEELANKRIRDMMWDPFDMIEKEVWTPLHPEKGTIGADAYDFKKKSEVKQSHSKTGMSDGGITAFWEYDESIDGDKSSRQEWRSDNIVCTYRYRPKTDDDFCEDVLKTCIWYGWMVYPEMNIPIVYKKFREWGYMGYLKFDIDPEGRMKNEPGVYLHGNNKKDGFSTLRTFFQYRTKQIKHLRLLEEARDITNIEDLRNYDMLASCMVALMGAQSQYAKVLQRITEESIDISKFGNMFRSMSY